MIPYFLTIKNLKFLKVYTSNARGNFSKAIDDSKIFSTRMNASKNHKPLNFLSLNESNRKLNMNYPGILIWSNFISCLNSSTVSTKNEGYQELLNEVNKLGSEYAFLPCNSEEVSTQTESYTISAYRVTGRPESSDQVIAPWGYGDAFNKQQLQLHAPSIHKLVEAVESKYDDSSNEINKLGPLRDVTINYRMDGMFKLDPHIDPHLDGSNVFILGLLSDVVFTLTPDLEQLPHYLVCDKDQSPLSIRTNPNAIATRSW